jgi:hypothetical protein
MQRAHEAAGVEPVPENGGGAGERLAMRSGARQLGPAHLEMVPQLGIRWRNGRLFLGLTLWRVRSWR